MIPTRGQLKVLDRYLSATPCPRIGRRHERISSSCTIDYWSKVHGVVGEAAA